MNWTRSALVVLSLLAILACNPDKRTTLQRAQDARATVLVDDVELRIAYTSATKEYPVEVRVKDLTGAVEANTEVYEDHAVINVDVIDVERRRDCLEAVIGHEMYHVVDARTRYGIPKFFALVERDKDLDWHQREVEKSAVAQEDALRQRLLNNPKYRGMAPTRNAQNSRAR